MLGCSLYIEDIEAIACSPYDISAWFSDFDSTTHVLFILRFPISPAILLTAIGMADPLSVSASVAGLITVADLVFQRVFKYLKHVRGGPEAISRQSPELGQLYGILNNIQLVVWQLDREPLPQATALEHIYPCEQTLSKIKAILDRYKVTSDRSHAMQTIRRLDS